VDKSFRRIGKVPITRAHATRQTPPFFHGESPLPFSSRECGSCLQTILSLDNYTEVLLLCLICSTGCKGSKPRLWNLQNLGAVPPYCAVSPTSTCYMPINSGFSYSSSKISYGVLPGRFGNAHPRPLATQHRLPKLHLWLPNPSLLPLSPITLITIGMILVVGYVEVFGRASIFGGV